MTTHILPTKDPKGNFPSVAWPGSYPIVYYTRNGLAICASCASRKIDDARAVISHDIYLEGPDIQCDDCETILESAYGDPDITEKESHT